jgi:hypothetical protein
MSASVIWQRTSVIGLFFSEQTWLGNPWFMEEERPDLASIAGMMAACSRPVAVGAERDVKDVALRAEADWPVGAGQVHERRAVEEGHAHDPAVPALADPLHPGSGNRRGGPIRKSVWAHGSAATLSPRVALRGWFRSRAGTAQRRT